MKTKTKTKTKIQIPDNDPVDSIAKDIHINEFKLKKEWLKQSSLVFHYASLATKTRKTRDLIARKIKVRHATLLNLIWNKPEKYLPKGRDKLTESIVDACIETDKQYMFLQDSLVALEYEHQMYKNVVDALGDKRKALEEVQELLMRSFYAEPNEKFDKKVREKINKKGG